ncbi:MAG: hypothetical protein JSU86_01950 [Phycisphaerales bacterium]|nr:MAG: hypothetical protein JSU86_01950 [Phycisphaerales bacterium]
MVTPKDVAAGKSEEPITGKDAPKGTADVTEPSNGQKTPPARVAVARKGPGTKEVIPFSWRLVGESDGFILTLFKSVDRDEAEAQLKRARADGYYVNLRVVDINEKIRQPASAKAAVGAKTTAKSGKPKTTAKVAKAKKAPTKAVTKAVTKAAASSKSAKSVKSAKPAKSAKSPTAKASAKSPKKKKTAVAKSTRKRPAKKK